MSTLLTPSDRRDTEPPGRRGSTLWRAAAAGLRASLLGLLATAVLLGLAWASAGAAGATPLAAARLLARVARLAHGGEVELASGRVGLVPLGLLAIPAMLLARAGRAVAVGARPATASCAARHLAALAAAYAAPVTALSLLADPGDRGLGAVPGTLTLAVVAGGWGMVRAPSPWSAGRTPRRRRSAVLAAGAAGALILLAAGAALAGTGLVLNFWRAVDLARSVAADPVAGGGLLLAQVSLVPNAATWGAAFAAGPGFALGSGTAVAPSGVVLGPLPAVPLLAALPGPGSLPPSLLLVRLIPGAAGIAAGALVLRRCRDDGPWTVGVLGAATGPVAGALLGLLCLVAGGQLGDGRLDDLGPAPLRVALVAGGQVAVAAAFTAGLGRRWQRSAREQS